MLFSQYLKSPLFALGLQLVQRCTFVSVFWNQKNKQQFKKKKTSFDNVWLVEMHHCLFQVFTAGAKMHLCCSRCTLSQFYSNIKTLHPPSSTYGWWNAPLSSWCKDAPLSQHRLKNNKKQTAISTPKQYQPSKPLSCDHFHQRVQSFHSTFKCGRYIFVPTEVQQPYNTELFTQIRICCI